MNRCKYVIFLLALAGLMLSGLGTAPSAQAAGPNPVVIFDTSEGRIIVMLYPKEAPVTVANFLRYVDEGFYDNTLFHRIVTKKDFDLRGTNVRKEIPYDIIQGGGYDLTMQLKPVHEPIINEAATALLNKKGTIAMARGAESDSATAQFFFNVEDNIFFDYKETQKTLGQLNEDAQTKTSGNHTAEYNVRAGYCAFGKVIRGMDVVEKMSQAKTEKKGGHQNIPVTPIIIKRAYRPQ